ncbi:MAG: DUF3800 domain-containing protein [Bryobacteraceae bacterium]
MAHLQDNVHFGDSRFSVGIQLANFCAYLIDRHLCAPGGDMEGMFRELCPMVVSGRIEPSVKLPGRVFMD